MPTLKNVGIVVLQNIGEVWLPNADSMQPVCGT